MSKFNKIKLNIYKYLKRISLIAFSILFLAVSIPSLVSAQTASDVPTTNVTGTAIPLPVTPLEVAVGDVNVRELEAQGIIERAEIFWNEWIRRVTVRNDDQTAKRTYKTGLHFVLNTVAFDLATWIASGGEGQQPAFVTEGWGQYLLDVGDAASGHFIEALGGTNWIEGFNVCEPNLQLKINIGLGLGELQRPSAERSGLKNRCTIKRAIRNWDTFLNSEDFLVDFQTEFSPEQNDIIVAFTNFDLLQWCRLNSE